MLPPVGLERAPPCGTPPGASSARLRTLRPFRGASCTMRPSTSLGTEVEGRMVQDAPLNGRNVLNLAELAPGGVPQGGALSNPTGGNIFGWGHYHIGGRTAHPSATL